MPNLGAIFLGSIPAQHRKFLRVFCDYMINAGFDKIWIPCVGQFGAAKVALEAGFKPENIYTSDISLFSSLLGYYYAGKPISEIPGITIVKPEHQGYYDKLPDDTHRIAFLMTLMKAGQLRESILYEKAFITEIFSDLDKYVAQIVNELKESREIYKGINYDIEDVRNLFYNYEFPKDGFVVMNPPAFKNGYTKMFAFDKYLSFQSGVQEFDFGAEYVNLYHLSKQKLTPFIWHTSRGKEDFPEKDIIYASQYNIEKYGYWIFTHPDMLDGFEEMYTYVPKKTTEANVVHYELMAEDTELTDKSIFNIRPITKETALYYRDLFAHRLGSTVAEIYFGIFHNGMLMSVCGFNTSFLRRLQETYIFENFCFSTAHKRYENLNRLSMMLLTSGQFKKMLEHETLKNSAYVDLKTFRTVCLTKYRKSKLNNNLLKLLSSEKQENGTYKLIYENEFYMERDYKECLRLYLAHDVRLKKDNMAGATEVVEERVTPEPEVKSTAVKTGRKQRVNDTMA